MNNSFLDKITRLYKTLNRPYDYCPYCNKQFNTWKVPMWAWNGLFLKNVRCPDCVRGKDLHGHTCFTCYGFGGMSEQSEFWRKFSIGYLDAKLRNRHVNKCEKKHDGILYLFKQDVINSVDCLVSIFGDAVVP